MTGRPAAYLWLSAVLPLSAETYTFYVGPGTPAQRVEEKTALVQQADPAAQCTQHLLKAKNTSLGDAEAAAQAIRHGALQPPCVVISDAAGAYAALPLDKLDAQSLAKAREAAASPTRKQEQAERDFNADCYLLFARLSLQEQTPERVRASVQECRRLMDAAGQKPQAWQELGLRALYPLLMLEYTQGYRANGAHTPETEAKLLEAIAALEAVRDLDPESPSGKKAHEERERLRMARRQARQAE